MCSFPVATLALLQNQRVSYRHSGKKKVNVVLHSCIPSALFLDWPSRNSLISMQLLILPPESVATG